METRILGLQEGRKSDFRGSDPVWKKRNISLEKGGKVVSQKRKTDKRGGEGSIPNQIEGDSTNSEGVSKLGGREA